jgi:hypothetical protein
MIPLVPGLYSRLISIATLLYVYAGANLQSMTLNFAQVGSVVSHRLDATWRLSLLPLSSNYWIDTCVGSY